MNISVIIPFYNTNQSYLHELFENITTSKHDHLEFVFIDDGSEKSISNFVREFCLKNNFLYYKFNTNIGVSNARNKGIEIANKPYLFFCDSDDLVDFSFLNDFSYEEADLYLFKDSIYKGKLPSMSTYSILQTDIVDDLTVLYLNDNQGLNLRSACCKIFNKKFLIKNHVIFNTKLRYYEDAFFMCTIYVKEPKFYAFGNHIYFYRLHSESSSKKFDINYFAEYSKFYFKFKNDFSFNKNLITSLLNDTFRKVLFDKFIRSFKKFHFKYCISIFKEDCIVDSCRYFFNNKNNVNKFEWRLSKYILNCKKISAFFLLTKHWFIKSLSFKIKKIIN